MNQYKSSDPQKGDALVQLALFPLTLCFAVVKGILLGLLAVITLGAIH